jgi:hypothetical protein
LKKGFEKWFKRVEKEKRKKNQTLFISLLSSRGPPSPLSFFPRGTLATRRPIFSSDPANPQPTSLPLPLPLFPSPTGGPHLSGVSPTSRRRLLLTWPPAAPPPRPPAPLRLPTERGIQCTPARRRAAPPPLPETAAPPAPPPFMAATTGARPHCLRASSPTPSRPYIRHPELPSTRTSPSLAPSSRTARSPPEPGAPPQAVGPDLLLRRVFLLSKLPGKVLVSSSFFWCSSRAIWWSGAHFRASSGELRRRRRPSMPPPPAVSAALYRTRITSAARSSMDGPD